MRSDNSSSRFASSWLSTPERNRTCGMKRVNIRSSIVLSRSSRSDCIQIGIFISAWNVLTFLSKLGRASVGTGSFMQRSFMTVNLESGRLNNEIRDFPQRRKSTSTALFNNFGHQLTCWTLLSAHRTIKKSSKHRKSMLIDSSARCFAVMRRKPRNKNGQRDNGPTVKSMKRLLLWLGVRVTRSSFPVMFICGEGETRLMCPPLPRPKPTWTSDNKSQSLIATLDLVKVDKGKGLMRISQLSEP